MPTSTKKQQTINLVEEKTGWFLTSWYSTSAHPSHIQVTSRCGMVSTLERWRGLSLGKCRGWNPTRLWGDSFISHFFRIPMKQAGFNGKYLCFFRGSHVFKTIKHTYYLFYISIWAWFMCRVDAYIDRRIKERLQRPRPFLKAIVKSGGATVLFYGVAYC